MRKVTLYMTILLITFTLYGCAKSSNVQLIENRNVQLQKDDAPIRLVYKEYKGGGGNFNPYLIGQIKSSIASELLEKDTLASISRHGEFKKISLIQTRAVKHDTKNKFIKEVWVVEDERSDKYAYLVTFTFPASGGTDIYLSGGYKTFGEMLSK